MKKLLWITAGLLVLDGLFLIFTRPLLVLVEGDHEYIELGVIVIRFITVSVGLGIGVVLLIAWCVISQIPPEKKNPGA